MQHNQTWLQEAFNSKFTMKKNLADLLGRFDV